MPLGTALDGEVFRLAKGVTFPPGDGTTLSSEGSGLALTVVGKCERIGYHGRLPAVGCVVAPTRPICGQAPDGAGRAFVVLLRGVWGARAYGDNSGFLAGEEPRFSASCALPVATIRRPREEWAAAKKWEEDGNKEWTGALAKCVALWHMNDSAKRLTACIHMARAAYEGLDEAHTRPGTQVDVWDWSSERASGNRHQRGCAQLAAARGSGQRGSRAERDDWQQEEGRLCSMWVEAEWDEHGAVCISHKRFEYLERGGRNPRGLFPVTLANDRSEDILHCRAGTSPKLLTPWSVQGATTLVVNRSEHHTEEGAVIADKPPPPRSAWDDAACVTLCSGRQPSAPLLKK
jgi:hypothetical protein